MQEKLIHPMLAVLQERGDMVCLSSTSEYQHYFATVLKAFKYLTKWYDELTKGGDLEQMAVAEFVKKILYTVQVMGIKHAHIQTLPMALDLNGSGYPHITALTSMFAEMSAKEQIMQKIMPVTALKDQMLDHMFKHHEIPTEKQAEIAMRTYLDALDPAKLIHQFTPGELIPLEKDERVQRYFYSWLCYDPESSIPFIHLLLFEYDNDAPDLNPGSEAYEQFVSVIRTFGNRVPEKLSFLSHQIDDKMEALHPKMLKRIRLGPLLTKIGKDSVESQPIMTPLQQWGDDRDFVLLIRCEVSVSKQQTKIQDTWLSSLIGGKVREIFAINNFDPECYQAGATEISRHMLLPHRVLQEMDLSDPAFVQYKNYHKVTYIKGDIHVIE